MDKYATRCTVAKVPFLSTLTVKNAEGKRATAAVSDRVAPLAVSVSLDLFRETPVTAIVAGAWAFWLIVIICFKAELSVA